MGHPMIAKHAAVSGRLNKIFSPLFPMERNRLYSHELRAFKSVSGEERGL